VYIVNRKATGNHANRWKTGDEDMTRKEATAAGWGITGTGTNMTAEKGRIIFMGSLALVLKMIEKVGG
tara:strand:+ start:189 stop:392 length:204 start_codon:yes stop_codon:yes gene_type:complete